VRRPYTLGSRPGLVSMIFVLVQPSASSACLRAPALGLSWATAEARGLPFLSFQ